MSSWRARLALGLLSAAGSLGATELWARGQEAGITLLWDQPGRGYATTPGLHGANRHGFHEREIPPTPDPSVRRVVVLGDSVTWGVGPVEQTWTAVAERALDAPWQVLNFGVYGYDTEACAVTLEEVARRWAPELVIYASYTNDLHRSTVIRVGRFGYPVWIGAQGALLPQTVRRRSALARAIEGAWLARGLDPQPDPAHYRAQVARLAAQSRAMDAAFFVFGLVPHVFAGEDCEAPASDCDWHRAAISAQEAQVRALGLPWIPAEPILDASGQESFFPAENTADIDHPGPEGRRVLGEGFAAALLRALQPAPDPEAPAAAR